MRKLLPIVFGSFALVTVGCDDSTTTTIKTDAAVARGDAGTTAGRDAAPGATRDSGGGTSDAGSAGPRDGAIPDAGTTDGPRAADAAPGTSDGPRASDAAPTTDGPRASDAATGDAQAARDGAGGTPDGTSSTTPDGSASGPLDGATAGGADAAADAPLAMLGGDAGDVDAALGSASDGPVAAFDLALPNFDLVFDPDALPPLPDLDALPPLPNFDGLPDLLIDLGAPSDAAPASDAQAASGNCNVPCLAGVADQCIPSGACTSQAGLSGANICYANGVKYLTSVSVSTSPPFNAMGTTNVTKPAGDNCYKIEFTGPAGGPYSYTYKDPNGATLATATVNQAGDLVFMCNSQTYTVPAGSCGAGAGSGTTCTQGSCQ
jgi:hypothetical protein